MQAPVGKDYKEVMDLSMYIRRVIFEVFTTGAIKNIFSWDLTPCILVEGYRISEEHTAYIFSVE
jgi:hypothetical protein